MRVKTAIFVRALYRYSYKYQRSLLIKKIGLLISEKDDTPGFRSRDETIKVV